MPLLADITETMTNALGTVSHVTGAEKVGVLADKATNYLAQHSAQLVGGTVVLAIGVVVTGWTARGLARLLERRHTLEPPERLLILAVLRLLMIGLTILVALDVCGYPVGAVITGCTALAVGVGLAIQGLMGNIIAGLTLIFTRHFEWATMWRFLDRRGGSFILTSFPPP